MIEIHDRNQLNDYLKTYNLESVFNEEILPYLSLYYFEEGENICSQGDRSEHLFVLVKGKVKIYTTSFEGKTLILSFRAPLDLIGDIEYIQGIDFINTVEAVSSGCMIGVKHSMLKKYVKEYAPFLQFLLKTITHKFYTKSNSMNFNLMYPVEVRLASYLLSVTFDENNTLLKGQLSTSRLTDTANLIGTSYRHLNRVIHQFCTEGFLERTKGFIKIIDKEGLQSIASRNIYE